MVTIRSGISVIGSSTIRPDNAKGHVDTTKIDTSEYFMTV
jgi:hypothetical protein